MATLGTFWVKSKEFPTIESWNKAQNAMIKSYTEYEKICLTLIEDQSFGVQGRRLLQICYYAGRTPNEVFNIYKEVFK